MGLNILVGHTGLVSFGHGAFFGLAGYAAALSQRHWFPGDIVIPSLFAIVSVALFAWLAGFLILRRRGVYFSLLTLALSAMLFAIAFRWTAVTGGESGLGGVVRPRCARRRSRAPVDLLLRSSRLIGFARRRICCGASIARRSATCWSRSARTSSARASSAIRPTATSCSPSRPRPPSRRSPARSRCSTIASPPPSRSRCTFSGELLAMVVIGGMRSFLGPALGALFFILFREFLSIWTAELAAVLRPAVRRLHRVLADRPRRRRRARARAVPQARDRSRRDGGPRDLAGCAAARRARRPQGRRRPGADRARACQKLRRHPRGRERRHRRAGPHAARADRPERRRQDHGVQSGVRHVPARRRLHHGRGPLGHRARRPRTSRAPASAARSRSPICSAGSRSRRTCASPCRRAHAKRFAWWTSAEGLADVNAETTAFMSYLGLTGMERAEAASLSYGGQRLLDMGLALATAPHILLLDEPLAGLAAAERTRVAALVKTISRQIPVLLVEHDIDRVFQIADVVTVMNEGAVLVHGSVDDARNNAKVREIYIGSGTAHVTARAAAVGGGRRDAARRRQGRHVLRQEPHPQRASRSTSPSTRSSRCSAATAPANPRLLKTLIGIAPPETGSIKLAGDEIARHPSRRDRAARHRLCAAGQGPVRRHDGRRQSRARPPQAPDRRGRALGRRAHRLGVSAPRAALVHAGRLSLRRRAADGRGRARARRRRAAAAARRAVRGPVARDHRGAVRGVQPAALRDRAW